VDSTLSAKRASTRVRKQIDWSSPSSDPTYHDFGDHQQQSHAAETKPQSAGLYLMTMNRTNKILIKNMKDKCLK